MADNDVGGSAKVATQVPHRPPPSHRREVRRGKNFDKSWHQLLCLFRLPLQQIFANRLPTSSQSTPVEPHRACRQEAPEPGDSEGASGPVKSAPTPPSSQGTVPSSSAHNASESSRKGKRRPESQAADDSVPVHKKTETADQSSSDEYKLVVVQEPTTGSAFEDNLLGRIGLAPPLIVELHVSKEGKIDDASTELPFLICQCSLLDESGAVADMVDQSRPTSSARASLMPPTPPTRGRRGRSSLGRRGTSASAVSSRSSASTEASTTGSSDDAPSTDAPGSQGRNSPQLARMLYGTIVAGPQQYVSPQSEAKSYFFFPEISVRTPGKFKIQCRLMRLALPGMPAPEQGVLTSTETQLFDVVKRSDYTAPYITDLSRHFARQGVPLLLPPGVSAD